VIAMLRDAIDMFVRGDAEDARGSCCATTRSTTLHRTLFASSLRRMIADPQQVERSMTLVLVGRNLERIGDLRDERAPKRSCSSPRRASSTPSPTSRSGISTGA
jgi:Na+/phosphate symporter